MKTYTYTNNEDDDYTYEDAGQPEAYYMHDDELENITRDLQYTSEEIQFELKNLVKVWAGHCSYNWSTLTPDYLSALNTRCKDIKNSMRVFFEELYRVLGTRHSDAVGLTAMDYEDAIWNLEFELEMMQVIRKSYEFSSGESQGVDGIVDLEMYRQKYNDARLNLLTPITVKPWVVPPAPKLLIPDRPRIILKVLSVSDSAPRVSLGFDDIFFDKPIARDVLVDEEVHVGDMVIVKISGWSGSLDDEVHMPEYDGLAEPGCPCSNISDVMEAKYDFDYEAELVKHQSRWVQEHMERHFTIKSENDIMLHGRIMDGLDMNNPYDSYPELKPRHVQFKYETSYEKNYNYNYE